MKPQNKEGKVSNFALYQPLKSQSLPLKNNNLVHSLFYFY